MANSFQPRPSVESVIDEDGAVLLDVQGGKYYSLNPMGAEIWRDIETRRTREDIVTSLRQRFDVPSLEDDVEAFIDRLCSLRLLEPV